MRREFVGPCFGKSVMPLGAIATDRMAVRLRL
jgi:hypothetical protein